MSTRRIPLLRGLPRRCLPVRLDVSALEGADDKPVWIEVAREGLYKGHPAGEFTLGKQVLEQIVRNFRNHPAYSAGADGWGESDVIAFDFHHESEKRGGAVAVVGAPAQAWALDLDVRSGADGKLELWALTRYLEPARTYVREDRYKWTSVALWPDAVDPVSGESIGWYLSSIAFTNDPFIQGMVPIAAARGHAGAPAPLLTALTDKDGEFAVSELRWIFGLPATAGVAELAEQLAQLEAMATGAPEAAAGVDVDGLVARLRDLLRLPLLTTMAEVLSQVRALLGQLGVATPAPSEPTTAALARASAALTTDLPMTIHDKLMRLARARGWPTTEDEIAQRIEAELAGADKLTAIGKLFGVDNPQAILEEVVKRNAELEKLKAEIPELQELLAGQAAAEDASADEDVEEAMAAHRMPPSAKPALLAYRTATIELKNAPKAELKRRLEERKAARVRFLQTYPLPPRAQRPLLQAIATQPQAAPSAQPYAFRALGGSHGGAQPLMPPAALGAAPEGEIVVDLERYLGRNITERAMAYVRAQLGGDRLAYDQVHAEACAIVSQLRAAVN